MTLKEIDNGDGTITREWWDTALCSTIGCPAEYEYVLDREDTDPRPPEGWSFYLRKAYFPGRAPDIESRLCPACTTEAIKGQVTASYARLNAGRAALDEALVGGGLGGVDFYWLREHVCDTTYPFYVKFKVEVYDPEKVAGQWTRHDEGFWDYEHQVCEDGGCDCEDDCPRVPAKDTMPMTDRLVAIGKALAIRERHVAEVKR